MRKFKFRAWDKVGSLVLDESGGARTTGPRMVEDVGISASLEAFAERAVWLCGKLHVPGDSEDFVLMQFVGMVDRKGREIYEGDIVMANSEMWGVVTWDEEIYRYYARDGYDDFGLDEFALEGMTLEGITVVGNIYENPEILAGG